MSKEKLIPYSDYFDEYPTDIQEMSGFYRAKIRLFEVLKGNFTKEIVQGQYYTECPRVTLGFLGVLLLLCSIRQSIDTIQNALASP
ncbi:10566_t:CDS:2 [Funneliformis mosseae]|uniref:10566_t:CDS:1 n=1 Tax=Funneliformis mosseae TaxID=27381 RepID=A0A9N9HW77_FUNMO|nr:10566_t:CDS:2 [Funneliformis mosseae]